MTDQEITEFLAARLGPILDEVIRLRAEKTIAGGTSKDWMETAYRRGVIDEREACAKVAENFGPSRPLARPTRDPVICGRWEGEQAASSSIAAAIRARGGE